DPRFGKRPRRFDGARIVRLGKHDAAAVRLRARADGIDEAHGGAATFARNASATRGCTRSRTSPPYRATSRTRLALMYVVSRDGIMNTVSRRGLRWRFMSAIWYSYSKSLTARRPRISRLAPTSRAKSTRRPPKDRTSMRGS